MKNTRKLPSSLRFMIVILAVITIMTVATACNNGTEPDETTAPVTTTEAPAVTTTEAPAVTTTEAPAVTTTKAPAVTTTEAPAVTTTEAPAVTTTEAPAVTTTKAPAVTTTKAPAATTVKFPSGTPTTPDFSDTIFDDTYVVTFLDIEDNIIAEVEVKRGATAKAPEAPAVEDHVFIGWSKSISNVRGNLTVKAQYKIKTFTVTFVDFDGKELEKQTVEIHKDTITPKNPTREHYTFKGWDKDFSAVTSDLTVTAQYEINKYAVIFLDKDGNELDKQTVNSGTAATAPKAPEVADYDFIGWDVKFDYVTSDLTVKAQYRIKTFAVVFVDFDGKEIDKQSVEIHKAATAPDSPTREHYTFKGWDKDFSAVTSDLTVTAQYEITTYTVIFIDHDGKELDKQTVNSGTAATAPANPTREDYTFTGWDKKFDYVTSDLTVKALYNVVYYTVIFVDHDGKEIAKETVESGKDAIAPTDPVREHYTFEGWDKEFTNVKSDLTVKATYAPITYTVIFLDKNGDELDKQTVNSGTAAAAPKAPAVEHYTFKGWDKEFDYVTSDLTVNAIYELNKYTVTFLDKNGDELDKQTVNSGEAATAPEAPAVEHYTFKGWDKEFDYVTSDLTVNAQYEIITYTVLFLDKDGKKISEQTVNSGEAAVAPEAPEVANYKFIGWDKEFDCVTSNLRVKAQYKEIKPTLIVDTVKASAGDTDIVVYVTIENNPGILGGQFSVSFDENALALTNSANGEATASLTYQKPSKYKSGCNFVWYGSDTGDVIDGTVLKLVFNVSATAAAGDYAIEIALESDAFYDANTSSVSMDVVNGKITVE